MMNPILIDLPDAIDTERLTLRVPRAGDGPALNAAVCESLSTLWPWMEWAKTAPTVDESEALCRRMYAKFLAREDVVYSLFLKGTATIIGGSGLHRIDWDVPRFEIGYWVRSAYAGQGYVTETVNALTHLAFETLRANRVEIIMDDRNERSWRVAERVGYTLEGILRHHKRNSEGGLRHTRIYAKVRWPDGRIG